MQTKTTLRLAVDYIDADQKAIVAFHGDKLSIVGHIHAVVYPEFYNQPTIYIFNLVLLGELWVEDERGEHVICFSSETEAFDYVCTHYIDMIDSHMQTI